nr:pentatricopeptide repeat protein AaPPR291 [Agave angustifolia]
MAFISSLRPHPLFLPQKPTTLFQSPAQKPSTLVPFSSTAFNVNLTHQIPPNFTSKDLLLVLRRQKDANSALELFTWASQRSDFTPNSSVFEEILQQLGKAGAFNQMKNVLQEMKLSQCKIDNGIFQIFIESFVRFQLFDKAVDVVLSLMQEFGVKPDTHMFNFLLNILVEESKIKLVESVYSSMNDRGIEPDVSTFNILIKALCKAHKLKPAVAMMEEMKSYGL